MELPVIIEYVRTFNGGFSLVSANLNPYSEKYSNELEDKVTPYVSKKYNTLTITASIEEEGGMQGGQYIFIGEFVEHPKFGHQFKAEFHYQDVPATDEGLKNFLMTLPNIKASRSQAIVSKFGVEGTFDILDNDINRLAEISGITAQRIPAIEKAWQEKKCMRDLYAFFMSKGLPIRLAEASYKRWGRKAQAVLEENPYRLVELRGVGFVMADTEAHKIMDVIHDEFRITACMQYVLQEATNKNSNLCIPYLYLKDNVKALIKKCDVGLGKRTDISKCSELIPKCLKKNLETFNIVKDLDSKITYIYLKDMWEKEKFIAKNLYDRSRSDHKKQECTAADLKKAQNGISKFYDTEIILDECQNQAIQTVFDHKVSIITGAGGTGKSMICRCIFELAQAKGLSIRMMSPTGKAAQVLETKTGCGASTIHRGLKLKPGDNLPREMITEDILLVDEISMCGVDTMYAMLKAMENNIWGNIVFVGDKNQLPSVSPGNFLSDIIDSKVANVVTLSKIHRQSENSYISLMANNISKGKVEPVPAEADDITWHNLSSDTFHSDVLSFIDEYLSEGKDINDLQFMSPMKKGTCGVYKLNEVIQAEMAKLNGSEYDSEHECLKRQFNKYYVGDRVIQLENNYEKMVFNGDMGVISGLGERVQDPSKSDKKEKFITVSFYGNETTYFGGEIDQLQLAWCITVHKFQGSQAPHIAFVMSSEAQVMMSKELVYTAFTRAEKSLDVFGHVSMLRLAPTRSVIRKRYTNFTRIIDSIKSNRQILKVLAR
jgi:exodeoxyribonuclease V alpha subunit